MSKTEPRNHIEGTTPAADTTQHTYKTYKTSKKYSKYMMTVTHIYVICNVTCNYACDVTCESRQYLHSSLVVRTAYCQRKPKI